MPAAWIESPEHVQLVRRPCNGQAQKGDGRISGENI